MIHIRFLTLLFYSNSWKYLWGIDVYLTCLNSCVKPLTYLNPRKQPNDLRPGYLFGIQCSVHWTNRLSQCGFQPPLDILHLVHPHSCETMSTCIAGLSFPGIGTIRSLGRGEEREQSNWSQNTGVRESLALYTKHLFSSWAHELCCLTLWSSENHVTCFDQQNVSCS